MLRGRGRFNSIFWFMTLWEASWQILISNEPIALMSEYSHQGENWTLDKIVSLDQMLLGSQLFVSDLRLPRVLNINHVLTKGSQPLEG